VEVDKSQITQVANNLILNAYQAMPNGGVISITARNTTIDTNRSPYLREGEYVEISFADTGVGIPKENLGRIFDPFFTTKEKGNGLGLSSALSIVRKHGGHLEMESEIGKGSSFRVYLPASRMTEEAREEVGEPAGGGDGSVLLMDDDEDILDVVGEILRTTGYRVEIARKGEEAIKMYRDAMENGRAFDVVIMDLTIRGGMGGKDAIAELIKIDPGVKAIVSSGYSNDPVMADFRRFGFVGVLQKPYSLAYLAKAIGDVIEKH